MPGGAAVGSTRMVAWPSARCTWRRSRALPGVYVATGPEGGEKPHAHRGEGDRRPRRAPPSEAGTPSKSPVPTSAPDRRSARGPPDQQQLLCSLEERPQPPEEALIRCDWAKRPESGKPKPPASSAGLQPTRQLQQRERYCPQGLGHNPVRTLRVEPAGTADRQQTAGRRDRPIPSTTSSGADKRALVAGFTIPRTQSANGSAIKTSCDKRKA